jgi:ABC-type phosphate transport system substrate-binding protein
MKTTKAVFAFAITMIALLVTLNLAHATPVGADNLIQSGHLNIQGSSTVWPVSLEAQNPFMSAHSSITVDIPAATGSGAGADAFIAGTTDMFASSKIPDAKYWNTSLGGAADLRIWAIGIDSVAIIVSASFPYYSQIKNVTAAQVSDLFSVTNRGGSTPVYTTWKQFVAGIGGDTTGMGDEVISRYTRVLDSGTHDSFRTNFLIVVNDPDGSARNDACLAPHTELQENQQMLTAVAGDNYGVGYIGMGFVETSSTVKALWIYNSALGQYVQPTKAHVLDGTYARDATHPIMRWLWYGTNGIPTASSEGAAKSLFISFVKMHPEYIDDAGYIRMLRGDFTGGNYPQSPNDSPPTHPSLPDGKIDFQDTIYYVKAYIAYYANGALNPYADFNADGQINFQDTIAYVKAYIAYYS